MNLQNSLTSCKVGEFGRNASVKTSRSEERRVERFGTVCSCENHNTLFAVKSVHLREELVEGLLALIIAAYLTVTLFTDSIDLINEHNARSFLVRLTEQVTNLSRTHSDKHLNEFRA